MSSKWMIQKWTTGELDALVKNLGGEKVARKIQRGEMKVSFEDVIKVLFDKIESAKAGDGNRFRQPHPAIAWVSEY